MASKGGRYKKISRSTSCATMTDGGSRVGMKRSLSPEENDGRKKRNVGDAIEAGLSEQPCKDQ